MDPFGAQALESATPEFEPLAQRCWGHPPPCAHIMMNCHLRSKAAGPWMRTSATIRPKELFSLSQWLLTIHLTLGGLSKNEDNSLASDQTWSGNGLASWQLPLSH